MTRIVASTVRNDQPPGKRREASRPIVWRLDQAFLLEGEETTIRKLCRAGLVTLVRYKSVPYAYIVRSLSCFERLPISEADFQTLEPELRAASLKRAQ